MQPPARHGGGETINRCIVNDNIHAADSTPPNLGPRTPHPFPYWPRRGPSPRCKFAVTCAPHHTTPHCTAAMPRWALAYSNAPRFRLLSIKQLSDSLVCALFIRCFKAWSRHAGTHRCGDTRTSARRSQTNKAGSCCQSDRGICGVPTETRQPPRQTSRVGARPLCLASDGTHV